MSRTTVTVLDSQMPAGRGNLPSNLKNNIGNNLDESSVGWLRETPATASIEEMRRRFGEDGYLLLKGLLPREAVLDVREEYFTLMSPTGIVKPNTSLRDGIWNDSLIPNQHHGVGSGAKFSTDDLATQLLVKAHVAPKYQELLHHPALRDMVRRFAGWEHEVLLKRNLIRHSQPGAPVTSIHYDKLFLRAGKAEFLTTWIPLGDIDSSGGSLMYLEKSARLGRDIEAQWTKVNADLPPEERISAYNVNMGTGRGLGTDAASYLKEVAPGSRWLVSNFEAGDVVFHDPYTIHCGSTNMSTEGKIRLSADVRFYEEGSDYDQRWMKHFWHPEDKL